MNIKPPAFHSLRVHQRLLLGALDAMKRTDSMRFKRLKKSLKNFGLLWQALRNSMMTMGFSYLLGLPLISSST